MSKKICKAKTEKEMNMNENEATNWMNDDGGVQ